MIRIAILAATVLFACIAVIHGGIWPAPLLPWQTGERPRYDVCWPLAWQETPERVRRATVLHPMPPSAPQPSMPVVSYHDGELISWTASGGIRGQYPWKSPWPPTLLTARRDLLVLGTPFEVVAIDAAAGKIAWSRGEIPPGSDSVMADPENYDPVRYRELAGSRLVNVRQSGRAECIDLENGTAEWEAKFPGTIEDTQFNGDVLAIRTSRDGTGRILLVDGGTGRILKVLDFAEDAIFDMRLGPAGPLLVMTHGRVQAFRTRDGVGLWELPTGENAVVRLELDLTHLYGMTNDGRLHCLRLCDGGRVWEAATLPLNGSVGGVRIQPAGDNIFVLGPDVTAALDKRDGRPVFKAALPAGQEVRTSVVTQRLVFVFSADRRERDPFVTLHAYDIHGGGTELPGGNQVICKLAALQDISAVDGALLIREGDVLRIGVGLPR